MTEEKTTRRVYSAEELHRLRASCSQPKLHEAIEEHDGEDAELVKEHVLRGSRSYGGRSYRSRTSGNSLRVPSNKENRSINEGENSRHSSEIHARSTGPVLGEIMGNGQILRPGLYKGRPSPTPSLKKKHAEAIVKAHGSPQHVRVTAGGRIVPSEQSPLCHPRYGYSAIKANGGLIKFAPNHPMGKAQWTQATQNGFVAQDIHGRMCQIVNGTILPLNEIDGALRLYVPAPNLAISSSGSSFSQPNQNHVASAGKQQRIGSQSKTTGLPDPSFAVQTNALELEYSRLEHELKELDKTEVLHGRTMGKAAKEALVGKRRELVITLDNIRKAIKSIKSVPLPDTVPTSPRPMPDRQSMSPPRNRLPAFLQKRMQVNNEVPPVSALPHAFNPFFAMAPSPPTQFGGQYGFHPPPPADPLYGPQPFGMQPPMYMPPPPFDGSMAPPFASLSDSVHTNDGPAHRTHTARVQAPQSDSSLPQTDGARSVADVQRATSPGRSHAVDIKAPEPKSTTMLKSNLNPMSPAYKPGSGVLSTTENTSRPALKSVKARAPTPLSPLHQLRPLPSATKAANGTDDTISPSKTSTHLHSSSVSSFATADFFPRNTREYSTRKYAYPDPSDPSEDKENISPTRSTQATEGSSDTNRDKLASKSVKREPLKEKTTPQNVSNGFVAPPGTPVTDDLSKKIASMSMNTGRSTSERDSRGIDFGAMPDRKVHNLSPKVRRQDFLFVQEDPSRYPALPSSSPMKDRSSQGEPVTTINSAEKVDFTEASTEWLEGYRAGLARKQVEPDHMGDFLDGYCAGLLKSKPTNIGPSTGSPTKAVSRRPSPSLPSRSFSRPHLDCIEQAPVRPPFETAMQSMDSLKEAVYAPSNENAILTPHPDGPRVDDQQFNLGSWAKHHEQLSSVETLMTTRGDGIAGFPFPDLSAPAPGLHELSSNDGRQSTASTGAPTSAVSDNNTGDRISSMTSMTSNIYRPFPGHRAFSPHLEWKTATSIASATGVAAGYFANAQLDGAPQSQRISSITSQPIIHTHGRFKEGSLDGVSNPPNSPLVVSPPMSPTMTAKDTVTANKDDKKSSPGKGNSPAKVKFEQIAGKVGIKVSVGGSNKREESGSPTTSPSGKRRWRDVWRNSRKETSQDEKSAAVVLDYEK